MEENRRLRYNVVPMVDKPKRRWFRFHLSTAILLSLTTGALMWANYVSVACDEPDTDYPDYAGIQHHVSSKRLGWPVVYTQLYDNGHRLNELKTMVIPLINFAIAIAIIALVASLSEYTIRRREARKP